MQRAGNPGSNIRKTTQRTKIVPWWDHQAVNARPPLEKSAKGQ